VRVAAALLILLLADAAAGQTGGSTPQAGVPGNAVRPGAPVDTSGFQYQRVLPDGPAELVTLPLDPAALAHSQGPRRKFADVRIVDDQNAQIPYLLEQRSEPLVLDLPIGVTTPRAPTSRSVAGARDPST
jgi:hypothetical protein